MAAPTELLSLPLEVLNHIGHFLQPRQLYDVSSTCQSFRAAVNSNAIWSRHSRGGHLLEGATSLVVPRFSAPPHDSLDPLCDQRLHFIRRSRLQYNFRNKQFVHNILKCADKEVFFLFQPYTVSTQALITYGNDYMFIAGRTEERNSYFVRVYNIRQDPQLVATLEPEQCQNDDNFKVNVADDKLVVLHRSGFLVYEISLAPMTLSFLRSVTWDLSEPPECGLFFGDFVIEKKRCKLNVWNVHTAKHFIITGPDDLKNISRVTLLNLSGEEGLVLLNFIIEENDVIRNIVRVYDVNARQFSFHFCFEDKVNWQLLGGVLRSNLVGIFVKHGNLCKVAVYERDTARLLVEEFMWGVQQCHNACIMDDCLVIPTSGGSSVVNLNSLKPTYILPSICLRTEPFRVLRGGVCDLVKCGNRVWDIYKRQVLLTLESSTVVTMNSSFSKVISMDKGHNYHIYSFW